MPADKGPRPGRRYSTFVGVAFLILIVVATVNTIRTQSGGTLGTSKDERGIVLPEFAVPNARTGPLDKDANIAQDDCSTSENPCPSDAGRSPACEIPRQGAIRVCDFFDRPLVLSFWFTRGADCLPTQDAVDRVASRYRGRVNFLSIDVRDDPSDVRRIADERGWTIPVGYDRDGAVSDLYRVGGCPTVAFAYPGGILDFAKVGAGQLSPPQLGADVQRLLDQSREREER
jgi:thiol-disulfide isomerase/thioredoxin